MNHKLTNGMKLWKGNGNTTTLLFSLKGHEIVHQERRGQVETIVMEHFNGILFHKSELLTSSIPISQSGKSKAVKLMLAESMNKDHSCEFVFSIKCLHKRRSHYKTLSHFLQKNNI